ncbi:MAG: carboxylesterase family protein [Sphingomonas sp.]
MSKIRLATSSLALCACTLSAPAFAQTPITIVATDSGRVRGSVERDVASWKGIPFAAPPVGQLRWRAPQPPAPWRGVRDATAYSHDCMQFPFPGDAAPLGTPPAEDCLYANVWKPTRATGKLPVLVWIYGGGFVNGGASPPTYTGAQLAKRGIMMVSFNYRIGRFGTFAHPQLTRRNADKGLLGNYGYMDQVAALKWVRRNIAAFGGDPANVTIMGESAGGMSVLALVTSPRTTGLFRKAVVLSGGDGGGMGGGGTLASAEAAGVGFAASKDIAANDPRALERLRALSAEEITGDLNLATRGGRNAGTVSAPFADGVLAVDVAPALASGRFAHVPLMIGATSNDIGGKAGTMVAGARRLAGIVSGQGVPVYYYRFSYVAQSIRGAHGADHASDIPYFLDTVSIKYGDRTTPRDRAAGLTASAYLVNFVKTGNPNMPGLPLWRNHARATEEMIDFSPEGIAVPGPDPWASAAIVPYRRPAQQSRSGQRGTAKARASSGRPPF